MSRRRKGRRISGVLLLDKPAGMSSNQALQKVRRAFDAQKGGHTGNLDPFATGMLPICLGEASKTAAHMLDASKSYRATARLGIATSTLDPEGEMTDQQAVPELDRAAVEAALEAFRGEIEQVPPMYSALKHQGRRLYELAREGVTVERKSRRVTIHDISLLSWDAPELVFEVHCSKGTYVRTLAADIAAALGTCAHLAALRRLNVEPFAEDSMISLDDVLAAGQGAALDHLLLPADAGLADWPQVSIGDAASKAFANGNPCSCEGPEGPVRVYSQAGRLLGLGECVDGQIRPVRVFLPDDPQSAD